LSTSPCPSGKTAATTSASPPVKLHITKYSTLPKFGFIVHPKHPGPRQGADRDRHEPRAGQRWTRRRRARSALQGGFGCEQWPSCLRHGADSVFAWLRARAHASTRSDMRGRARTNKSCGPDARGLCVKSCGDVAARPGARISHLHGDGGNSASLPGESTKDTLKPSRREGRAIRRTCDPPRVQFYRPRICGCQPAPGLPCALVSTGAMRRSKLGRNAPRDRERSSAVRQL